MDRTPTERELVHERLGPAFEAHLSTYDTQRRVDTLIDEFLGPERLAGKQALDVGCGRGYFSDRLQALGADVTACDIGPGLVAGVRERVGCRAEVADALGLLDHFGPERFDVVVSSECIEHVPRPQDAVVQMAGVLKPGGYLSLSTPNVLWWPVVALATKLKLRPFDGYENFSSWSGLRRLLRAHDISILSEKGLHLFPFQLPLHGLSRWCDQRMQALRPLMINICLLGRKGGQAEDPV